jgi:protein ImuB
MTADPSSRTIVVWLPDWPIVAVRRLGEAPSAAPVALVSKGTIFACSSEARGAGVRRGIAVRESQLRCPELWIAPHDPGVDGRAFEPAVSLVESIVPGVRVLRPGLCAIRARGAARFYGGEPRVAELLLAALADNGFEARVGVADSVFAAEQAAQRSTVDTPVRLIAPGASAAFLAPLPVSALDEPHLVPVLKRLGLQRLGDLAALPPADVRARFGEAGRRAHAQASASDAMAGTARTPPPEFDALVEFEPALDRVDQLAFAIRSAADDMVERLVHAMLVCTAIRITIDSESGQSSDREWTHPQHFTGSDIVDRVRWQVQGAAGADTGLASAISRVRVSPASVDAIVNHEVGLWGSTLDEKVHHGLSRLQSLLGHAAVSTAAIGGGRFLAERRTLTPWGERARPISPSDSAPWPGAMPDPPPATVFTETIEAEVLDEHGARVDVDERGTASAAPVWFSLQHSPARGIQAWAGPWPVRQRWWRAEGGRRADRFQIVDAQGDAWLIMLENHEWRAEARYD